MPISSISDYSDAHWSDVRAILEDAIEDADFAPNLVSDADDVGIIQKRIVQNLYENPVVVCDVSGKNPNVMFELGLRLAFDKPTIIVKDDKTTYSFDTAPIEHVGYPRDLRFGKIVDFKKQLTEKIKATNKASADPNFTTFLKHFGTFKVAALETKEASPNQILLEELQELRRMLMNQSRGKLDAKLSLPIGDKPVICVPSLEGRKFKELVEDIQKELGPIPITTAHISNDHFHIYLPNNDGRLLEALAVLSPRHPNARIFTAGAIEVFSPRDLSWPA